MLRRWLNSLAVAYVIRRTEHEIPDNARLVWLWVERVEMTGPNGQPGHKHEVFTSPADLNDKRHRTRTPLKLQ